jgi:hypothetical protein
MPRETWTTRTLQRDNAKGELYWDTAYILARRLARETDEPHAIIPSPFHGRIGSFYTVKAVGSLSASDAAWVARYGDTLVIWCSPLLYGDTRADDYTPRH